MDCPICCQLDDVETSFYKYAWPEYDIPLPEAAGKLVILPTLDASDPQQQHVRRCPLCGRLYHYSVSYEYLVNGSEDEEQLARMTDEQAAAYLLAQARQLESLRAGINTLEWNAGSLGDYIDRGHPSPAQQEESQESMEQYRQEANKLRARLKEQVESLRSTCPEILALWSQAHQRVCRSFLESLPATGLDGPVARHVAQEMLTAWQALPSGGESYIMVYSNWLEGYDDRLEQEFGSTDLKAS